MKRMLIAIALAGMPAAVGQVNLRTVYVDASQVLANGCVPQYNTQTQRFSCATVVGGQGGGVADPGADGIMVRTGANVTVARTLTPASNRVVITNGNGATGNPTIDVNQSGLTIGWGQISGAPTFVDTAGSYANPSWIFSLPWGKITGVPTFLAAANNLSDVPNAATARSNLQAEAAIAAGTVGQFWRGDKSWQTIATCNSTTEKTIWNGTAFVCASDQGGGGGGSPGGTAGQIQFNDSGTFGGLDSTGTGSVVRANSPALTGTPTAPTAVAGTATTQIATTAFVDAATATINGTAPISVSQVAQTVTVALAQSGATNGQVLKWNGSAWAPAADDTGSGGTITLTGNVTGTGTGTIATTIADNAVTTAKILDASVTMAKLAQAGATSGQVIKWNGTAWAPAADATGGGSGCGTTNITCADNGTGSAVTNNITTTAGNFFIRQTGGTDGASRFGVANDAGLNGAYIRNDRVALALTDMQFQQSSTTDGQGEINGNIRWEARGVGQGGLTGDPWEFQFARVQLGGNLQTFFAASQSGIWLPASRNIRMRGSSTGTITVSAAPSITDFTWRFPAAASVTVGDCIKVSASSGGVVDHNYGACGSGGAAPAGTGTETQYRIDANTLGAIPSSYNATTRTLTYDFGSVTGLTASTEASGFVWQAASRTWQTGNFAQQRGFRIHAPTLDFVGSSTVTTASTLYVEGPPAEGASATITNRHGLHVDGAPTASSKWQLVKLGPTALASPSASGTVLGYNGPAFSGNFLDFQSNGTRNFSVSGAGAVTAASVTVGNVSLQSTPHRIVNTSAGNITGELFAINYSNGRTGTSGTTTNLRVGSTLGIQSGSGTMTYRNLYLADTFDQRTTATGPTFNLVVEPTVTGAADFTNVDLLAYTYNILGTNAPGVTRNMRIRQMTVSRGSSYSLAQNNSLEIDIPTATGITVQSAAGLRILGSTIANTTEGYGAVIAAPSGATRNFALRLSGMLVFDNLGARPSCDTTLRGAMAFVHGDGSTTSDTLSVCYVNAAGISGWKEVVP